MVSTRHHLFTLSIFILLFILFFIQTATKCKKILAILQDPPQFSGFVFFFVHINNKLEPVPNVWNQDIQHLILLSITEWNVSERRSRREQEGASRSRFGPKTLLSLVTDVAVRETRR